MEWKSEMRSGNCRYGNEDGRKSAGSKKRIDDCLFSSEQRSFGSMLSSISTIFHLGLSYPFNDVDNTFNESQCRRRRRPKSYVMATSSGFPSSASDGSVEIQNTSDVKFVSLSKFRFKFDRNKKKWNLFWQNDSVLFFLFSHLVSLFFSLTVKFLIP